MTISPVSPYEDGLISVTHEDEKVYVESSTGTLLSRSPSTLAPQTIDHYKTDFYSAPEAAYDSTKALYVVDNKDASGLELSTLVKKKGDDWKEWHNSGAVDPKKPWKKSLASKRARVALLVLAAILVALAVGLGVGLTKHPGSIQDLTNAYSTGLLINETSFSATITSDNNRHIFYQGSDCSILHSQTTAGSDSWLHNNLSQIMNSDYAMCQSPFASISSAGNSGAQSDTGSFNQSVILLYVNQAGSLTARSYQPGGHLSDNMFNASLPVKKDTRTIKMTPLPMNSKWTTEAIISYESVDNGPRVLHAFYYVNQTIALGNAGFNPIWQYNDITKGILQMQYEYNSTTNVTLPVETSIFDCGTLGGYSNPAVILGYLIPAATSLLPRLFVGQLEWWTNGITPSKATTATDTTITSASTLPGLGIGDTAMLAWRTGGQGPNTTHATQPVWTYQQKLYNFSPALDVPFPFPRFGWTASNTTTNELYLYSQVNGSTIAESQFIGGIQWETSYIMPKI